uniref:Cyclic nucleotide-binding domain-containing protein n=1 Tax=Hemiselmis tepida TaxID=464990 RepID=A0A7S0VSY4_9CRYP|mmetsp:Transcript_2662/g.6774  ORF Transcript_2662/g.6774 Transcript_2662/m.6774 type:complete len:391 (+) Transcript_2662:144-1316(+)|eukprot:CAMPEP_0174927600 /NCGR_PEP_ID=MMETSP1355-20121228/19093_1 /TAXON_ID=464990 /ORGANISM="Hemiselmis tepida, Strain CCMP443" /LENGTH=390 /DNA_ID=CAMNT_0016173715 /DNA_START=144 /DNA_END=1316 /DNA_ORIENTATION=-
MSGDAQNEKSLQAKKYLENSVVPVLTQALTQMCITEPEDPFTWLAQWLVENHPTKPSKAEWAESLVLKLQQGSFFGEIALLSGKPRQATVRAVGQVTLLVIGRDAFQRLCGNLFEILRRNMSAYSTLELPPEEEAPKTEEAAPEEEAGAAVEEAPAEEEEPAEEVAPKRAARGRRTNVFVEAVELDDDWEPPQHEKEDAEGKRLEEYIGKTALLAYLDEKAKKTVIGAFQKKQCAKDEDVIKQGEDGDYYYILDSGHTDVYIKKGDDPEIKVFEYSAGGAFGELALLHGEPRLATVRCTEDCVLWALDRDTFRKIMMSTGKQDMSQRVEFLSQVSLLEELMPFERFRLAEAMELRKVEDGTEIVKEGDPGSEFYIIQSGVCHCFKKTLKF